MFQSGFLTLSRGRILVTIEPFNELSFFGLLSSTSRTPYRELKRTSSSSEGCVGVFALESVDI